MRFKLREDRRQEVRDKAEREEEREKLQIMRLERNKRWREKKQGTEVLEDAAEEKVLDEKEERIKKNKEWRERREVREKASSETEDKNGDGGVDSKVRSSLCGAILPELHCQNCHELLTEGCIYQCAESHRTCSSCNKENDQKVL